MSRHNRQRRLFRTYLNGTHKNHKGAITRPPMTGYHAARLKKHGKRKLQGA